MNRRHFLALLTGAAGLVLDPDLLLWVPGQKTYVFLQPPVARLTLAQIVAIEYERAAAAFRHRDMWADSALLAQLERRR